jgi:mannose-6-phosphate isomerase-like protein (cupin superfamily)
MLISRERAEHYTWGQVCEGWRLLDEPGLSVIEERIPPGAGELRHVHHVARQLFYVLEGRLTIERDGERFELSKGDALDMPPERPHSVCNEADIDAFFLVISAPSTRGDRTNLT